MSLEVLRVLERIHGHLGWLAAIALIHPAVLLRNPRRRARLSAVLATATTTLTVALGAFIYGDYSRLLRREIYLASMRHGFLFERKEHLAFAAVGLAWAGCALHLGARGDDPGANARARAAHLAYVGAALLTILVASMGIVVAAFRSF
jgi:hypothetical protein